MPDTSPHSAQLLGLGLYTASEAAGLLGLSAGRIRRWLLGYAYGEATSRQWSAPLWAPQIGDVSDLTIGFRDLMELRFVAGFLGAGVRLPTIRRALEYAREMTGDERPFSTARFNTDGRTVFLQVADTVDDPRLVDLLHRQYAFHRVVAPSFRDLDFGDGVPDRWWPMSRRSAVMVDPARNFGHPIVASHGVPTRAVVDALASEGSEERVAQVYQIPLRAVRDAVAFERRAA